MLYLFSLLSALCFNLTRSYSLCLSHSLTTDQWLERYQEENTKEAALAELLILVIELCCGKLPTKEELSTIYQTAEENHHYYLVDKERLPKNITILISKLTRLTNIVKVYRSSKDFEGNLRLFWQALVSKCQDGPLFDGIVFEKCLDYLIHLSRIMEYRQNATQIGLLLLDWYMAVAHSPPLTEITDRKYDGPHVKSYSDTHEITVLSQMIMKIFHGLFVNRFQDDDTCVQGQPDLGVGDELSSGSDDTDEFLYSHPQTCANCGSYGVHWSEDCPNKCCAFYRKHWADECPNKVKHQQYKKRI